MACQRPCGTLALMRWPRGAQRRRRAILVLVQVSSMNTSRVRSIRSRYLVHCARRRATSGRSCSAEISVFFVTKLLGVDELPHRAIVDLEATLSVFGYQPAHSKICLSAALHQPVAMRPCNLLRPMAADLVRFDAAGLEEARARAHAAIQAVFVVCVRSATLLAGGSGSLKEN